MKSVSRFSVVFLGLGVLASADTFQTLPDRATQNPTDILDWTQLGPDIFPAQNQLSTPQLVSTFNGNLALVGNIDGSPFIRVDEGVSWRGNFDYGESLVWTGNSNLGIGGLGPFAMIFQNPVASFGFDIQADLYGPFQASVEVLDPFFNPLTFATFNGVSDGLQNGSALFVGLLDTTAVNIGAILITTSSGGAPFDNDFAIDDPSFTGPEPNSIVLLASSLAVVAWLMRRKLSRTPSAN